MHLDKAKFQVLAIENETSLPAVRQLVKTLNTHSTWQLQVTANFRSAYPILNLVESAVILISIEKNEDIIATLDFLTVYKNQIKRGQMKAIVLSSLSHSKIANVLSEKGCQDLLDATVPARALLARIQDAIANIPGPSGDLLLAELGISKNEIVQPSSAAVHEFSFLDIYDEQWKRNKEAFDSIKIDLKMKKSKKNPSEQWQAASLIETNGHEIIIAAHKDTITLKEDLRFQITFKDGNDHFTFEINGTVTSVDGFEGEPEQIVSIAHLSGELEKLKTLADLYSTRQKEAQAFLKAAKGI